MYAAVWTPLVYAVTTAAAGMPFLSGYGHSGRMFWRCLAASNLSAYHA